MKLILINSDFDYDGDDNSMSLACPPESFYKNGQMLEILQKI